MVNLTLSPYDNLSAKQCHGKSLPCSVNATSLCLSQDDANTIYRIGQWEYAWRWRGSPQALQYSALKMGPWVTELLGHLNAVKSGQSCMKYMHNFAHDGSIAPLFGIFQLDTVGQRTVVYAYYSPFGQEWVLRSYLSFGKRMDNGLSESCSKVNLSFLLRNWVLWTWFRSTNSRLIWQASSHLTLSLLARLRRYIISNQSIIIMHLFGFSSWRYE